MRSLGTYPSPDCADLHRSWDQLEHGLPSLGMHGLDIARKREPATTDVQDIGRRPKSGTERRGRVGEAPHVTEDRGRSVRRSTAAWVRRSSTSTRMSGSAARGGSR